MKRILVGLDGTGPAVAALGWATRLAEQAGAEIILANVIEPHQAELSVGDAERLATDVEHHLLTDWSAPLQSTSVTWSTVVLTGEPDALLEAADREDADLIVVGTKSHGTHTWLHIGSLSHHLAHLARRPLAIIPESAAHVAADRIVVGVDGSEGARAATKWVADLASETGAHVRAVYVFEPFAEWVSEADPNSWIRAAQNKLGSDWIEPLHAQRVAVETSIIEDVHPVAALTTAAGNEGAGLIVVGTARVRTATGMRLGRIPLQLVHHAQVPVVLVPPGPSEPDPARA